jgi:hypothetical protein
VVIGSHRGKHVGSPPGIGCRLWVRHDDLPRGESGKGARSDMTAVMMGADFLRISGHVSAGVDVNYGVGPCGGMMPVMSPAMAPGENPPERAGVTVARGPAARPVPMET